MTRQAVAALLKRERWQSQPFNPHDQEGQHISVEGLYRGHVRHQAHFHVFLVDSVLKIGAIRLVPATVASVPTGPADNEAIGNKGFVATARLSTFRREKCLFGGIINETQRYGSNVSFVCEPIVFVGMHRSSVWPNGL